MKALGKKPPVVVDYSGLILNETTDCCRHYRQALLETADGLEENALHWKQMDIDNNVYERACRTATIQTVLDYT